MAASSRATGSSSGLALSSGEFGKNREKLRDESVNKITTKFNWERKSIIWEIENISEAVGRKRDEGSGSGRNNPVAPVSPSQVSPLPQEHQSMLDIDYINSTSFEAGSHPNNKSLWSLSLYKFSNTTPESLGLFIHLLEIESDAGVNRRFRHNHSFDDYDNQGLYIKYHMSVINSRGTVLHKIENETIINILSGHSWGEDKFIPLPEILDPKSKLISGEKLRMKVDLWLFQQLDHSINLLEKPWPSSTTENMLQQSQSYQNRVRDCKLSKSENIDSNDQNQELMDTSPYSGGSLLGTQLLGMLWAKREFADITIQCGDQSFPIHKCIICTASPVFKAMFSNNMSESCKNQVDILDTGPKVLETMLGFLYTGRIMGEWDWNDFDKVAELVDICEKYEIWGLKDLCFEMICDRLTCTNVAKVTILVNLYNAEEFVKDYVHQFIVGNIKTLRKSENFVQLLNNHPVAFAQVLLSDELCHSV